MKIVLEGEQAEVMALIQAMAGQVVEQITPVVKHIVEASEAVETQAAKMPDAFGEIVTSWLDGFSVDGRDHWDNEDQTPRTQKGEHLRDLGNSRDAGATLKWIRQQGGLTHAVQNVLNGDTELSRGVAVNMAQVASILFPDLAQTLEHFDPFED